MFPSTPMATSIASASIVCGPLGVSMVAFTPPSSFSTFAVFEPVSTVDPALLEALAERLAETSSSSIGRRWSSISTIVTLVPMAL